ncbi:hypothetical protein [Pseudonocardia sp.]|jgi:hypothetical protein|uniref:hypothetical protein n=1 Tax=Pseudonocardia sp. TaxID=60912 RepID=UPI003D0AAA95
MPETHACGPDSDDAFFTALAEVFDRFPDKLRQYAVSCVDHETDIMKIDFDKQTAIARIEDGKVVERFADRGGEELAAGLICCKWWRSSDNTWECLKRWDHAVTGVPVDEKVLKPPG